MFKTSQAMGREWQGVGDSLATRRQRAGLKSATRSHATSRFGWDDVEDKLSNEASKAMRWRCVGDASVTHQQRVGVASSR